MDGYQMPITSGVGEKRVETLETIKSRVGRAALCEQYIEIMRE